VRMKGHRGRKVLGRKKEEAGRFRVWRGTRQAVARALDDGDRVTSAPESGAAVAVLVRPP
jgi:hypothetical protein